ARKVVFPRIEEHSVEQSSRSVERRRITRPQLAVDLNQRFLWSLDRIPLQGLADYGSYVVALGEEQVEFDHAGRIEDLGHLVGGQFRVGFQQDLAGGGVHHVGGNPGAFEIGNIDFDFVDLGFVNFFQDASVDLPSR